MYMYVYVYIYIYVNINTHTGNGVLEAWKIGAVSPFNDGLGIF
jgi:hypothetical protein